jgi:hypothetical protein
MNIIVEGDEYRLRNSVRIIKDLPLGVYTFQTSMFGPYLTKGEDLILPSIIYKNDKGFINHVLKTWHNSSDSIGILLTGKKGLGKSFTANVICAKLSEKLPVIKITREVGKGAGLIELLNDIKQDHIIYIDEFEKIFGDENNDGLLNQKAFLSFLDGGNNNGIKKLFIITTNKPIDDLFINRPSRLRYVRQYDYLHIDTIREVVESRLNNKEFLEDLLSNVDQDSINIDILIKVIDEVNLHNIPYSEFKDFFNYKIPEGFYDIAVKLPNHEHPIYLNPMASSYLNQIKNRSIRHYNFGYLNDKNGDYYDFAWNLEDCGEITRVDSRLYTLKVRGELEPNNPDSDSTVELETIEFFTEITISKQMRQLIF